MLVSLVATVPLARQYGAERASAALDAVDLRSAEIWLARLQLLGRDNPETLQLELRYLRKKGTLREFHARLQDARKAGLPEAVLQRESLLSGAQTGDLSGLEQQLPDLLIAGDDLDDICEAFVTGCLLSYRLDDATRVLEIWRADFPQSARPVFLLSRLREHADDLSGAADGYRQALLLNARHGPAAFGLGRVLEQTDDLAGALDAYSLSRGLLYHPEPATVSMVRVLRRQGRLADAHELLAALNAAQENSEERELAWLLAGATRQNALTDRLVEVAELHVAMGEKAEALNAWHAVLEADPQLWKLRYRLGLLLRELGHDEAARQELATFQAASDSVSRCDVLLSRVRSDPQDVEARFEIGCEFLDHLSETQGLIWLRTVLDLDPNHAGALARLAAQRTKERQVIASSGLSGR